MIATDVIPAVAYLRRSTDRQEQSLGDQRKEIVAFAERHGYRVVGEYIDDAISGTSAKGRPGFQRMIDDARRGEFRAVIVWNSDRFSRGDVTETEHYRYLLRSAGVQVLSVTEDYLHREGIDGDILRAVKQFQNRQFSISLSQNTLRGQISSVLGSSDPGRTTPYGYDREMIAPDGAVLHRIRFLEGGDREVRDRAGALLATYRKGQMLRKPSKEVTARLVLADPRRVEVVRDIFRLCIEGVGFKGIADELNRRGILSPRGRLWAFTTIKALIENPVYRGDIVWNRRTESKFYAVRNGRADRMRASAESGRVERMPQDEWIVIEGAVPMIVDRETWDRAQAMATKRSLAKGGAGKQTRRWLLSGLMRCACCGFPYWGSVQRKGHIPGRTPVLTNYYTCSGRRGRGKTVCPVPASVRADDLEAWVLAKLRTLVTADTGCADEAIDRFVASVKGAGDDAHETHALERELAEIDATVNGLLTKLDPANLPLVNDRLTQMRRRREDIQKALRATRAKAADLDEAALRRWAKARIDGLADAMAGRRNEKVRQVVASFVEAIVIDPATKTGVLRLAPGVAGLVGPTGEPGPELGGGPTPPTGRKRRDRRGERRSRVAEIVLGQPSSNTVSRRPETWKGGLGLSGSSAPIWLSAAAGSRRLKE